MRPRYKPQPPEPRIVMTGSAASLSGVIESLPVTALPTGTLDCGILLDGQNCQ
jgi:hypothetical protein